MCQLQMILEQRMETVEQKLAKEDTMKKRVFAHFILCCCMALVISCALADGYETGDHWDQTYTGTGGIAVAEVISKSVTLRDKPSPSGKTIVSIPTESYLMVLEEVDESWIKVSWQEDKGKTYTGYIRSAYVVINPEYITLRKSNTPAYSVPSRNGKLLGSLAKMTRLRVIGEWDDYYVVFLRGGSAFIHKDADLWTETELNQLRESTYTMGGYRSKTTSKTSLRTGPGSDWPEIMELKNGTSLDVSAQQKNGWVFVKDLEGNAGYISVADLP